MNSFAYFAPTSITDALKHFADSPGDTVFLAGGTDLITAMKQNLITPRRVISLRRIPELQGIRVASDQVRIGAATSLAELRKNPTITQYFPGLIQGIEGIGSPQMLNLGTLGGELCQWPRCWYFRNGFGLFGQWNGKHLVKEGDNRYHAVFGNDGPAAYVHPSRLAPVLMTMDAVLRTVSPKGETREISLMQFYRIPTQEGEPLTVLAPGELVTEVVLPLRERRNALYEVKHRSGLDWPYVSAAVAFDLEGGACTRSRVVLGHVAPIPWDVPEAAAVLDGKAVTNETAEEVAAVAVRGAKPLSGNGYKIPMLRAAVKRAVRLAAGLNPLEG